MNTVSKSYLRHNWFIEYHEKPSVYFKYPQKEKGTCGKGWWVMFSLVCMYEVYNETLENFIKRCGNP